VVGNDTDGINVKIGHRNFLKSYLEIAPISLALVRAAECRMLSSCRFEKPALDIGCGEGLFSSILFGEPLDVGLDISPKEVQKAEQSGMYKQVWLGDSSKLPCDDKLFRTVLSNCVIEHVEQLEDTFKEAFRVLQPGGRFIFTTHSHLYEDLFFYTRLFNRIGLPSFGKKYARFWTRLWRHRQFMSIEAWSALLTKVGFEIERSEYYFPTQAVTLFDLFLPLAAPSYLTRRITGKWRLWRRTITIKPLLWFLEKAHQNADSGNWSVLMVAKRPEK
jgi:ubiquinone/menaquinone biosynthesis C-methylase UbiE